MDIEQIPLHNIIRHEHLDVTVNPQTRRLSVTEDSEILQTHPSKKIRLDLDPPEPDEKERQDEKGDEPKAKRDQVCILKYSCVLTRN